MNQNFLYPRNLLERKHADHTDHSASGHYSDKVVMVHIDIAGHSRWPGSQRRQQETLVNVRKVIEHSLSIFADPIQSQWQGDGGYFLFSVLQPECDYDLPVISADFALQGINFFNSNKPYLCRIDEDVEVRAVATVADISFHPDPGHVKSREIDFVLKHERLLSKPGTLAITEALYDELYEPSLCKKFVEHLAHIGEDEAIKVYHYTHSSASATRRYAELKAVNRLMNDLTTYDDIFERHAERLLRNIHADLKKLHSRDYPIYDLRELSSWMKEIYLDPELMGITGVFRLTDELWELWSQAGVVDGFLAGALEAAGRGVPIRRIYIASSALDVVKKWWPLIVTQARGNIEIKVIEEGEGAKLMYDAGFSTYARSEGASYVAETSRMPHSGPLKITMSSDLQKARRLGERFEKIWSGETAISVQSFTAEEDTTDLRNWEGDKTITIRSLVDKGVYLRSFRKLSEHHASYSELLADAKMSRTDRFYRKCDPEYAKLAAAAIKRLTGSLPRRFFYFGDSVNNDGAVIRNLEKLTGVPCYGYICKESSVPSRDITFVGNMAICESWGYIGTFLKCCVEMGGESIDASSVVILDLDKTVYGAAGRNDGPLSEARVSAALTTASEVLQNPDQRHAFSNLFHKLDNDALYHQVTHDNQDYVVFIALCCALDIIDFDKDIHQPCRERRIHGFREIMVDRVILEIRRLDSGRGSENGNERQIGKEALERLNELSEQFWEALIEGDPTPFKRFRELERISTIKAASGVSSVRIEDILQNQLVMTREVIETVMLFKSAGIPVVALSDRPEESTVPTGHTLESHLPGECLLDTPMAVVGTKLSKDVQKLFEPS